MVAEPKGFEPSRPFRAYSLSRGAPSTARPQLRRRVYQPNDVENKGHLPCHDKSPKLCPHGPPAHVQALVYCKISPFFSRRGRSRQANGTADTSIWGW